MADPAVQKFILKVLMSLPSPVLRADVGRRDVYRGGRTLDPRFQFLAAAARQDAVDDQPGARRGPRRQRPGPGGSAAARPSPACATRACRSTALAAPCKLRAYRPADQDSGAPLIVFAHFGGGVIGDLETCRRLLRHPGPDRPHGGAVGRLPPGADHRFPAGLDDVLAAYRWGRDNAARFGAPPGRGGDRRRLAWAATSPPSIAQEMTPRRARRSRPCSCSSTRAVDVASETASMTTYADAYPAEPADDGLVHGPLYGPRRRPGRPAPVAGSRERRPVGPGPGRGGHRRLRSRWSTRARPTPSAWSTAGVPATYRCYDSLAHGFTAFTGAVPAADASPAVRSRGLVRAAFDGLA